MAEHSWPKSGQESLSTFKRITFTIQLFKNTPQRTWIWISFIDFNHSFFMSYKTQLITPLFSLLSTWSCCTVVKQLLNSFQGVMSFKENCIENPLAAKKAVSMLVHKILGTLGKRFQIAVTTYSLNKSSITLLWGTQFFKALFNG